MAFGALTVFALAGCGAGKADLGDELADVTLEAGKADLPASVKLIGSIDYNTTSKAVKYTGSPTYAAFKFAGKKGDKIEINVRSKNGDAYTYLRDDSFKLLARNDDADQTTFDSHITYTLPGNKNPDINTYYIVFRDYARLPASFTVELKGPAGDFFSCQRDADCVAVPQVGCCHNGYNAAVNVNQVDAYESSFTCPNTNPICPLFIINDTRVAECNTGTGKCEMVAIDAIACGGFTINPHKCPEGYTCQLPRNVADVPGSCVEEPKPQTCGGIAGIQCPDGQVCVDNPNDSCDPNNGGADCGGICQPAPSDCRTAGCPTGDYCSFCFGKFACIPNGALC